MEEANGIEIAVCECCADGHVGFVEGSFVGLRLLGEDWGRAENECEKQEMTDSHAGHYSDASFC